MSYSILDADGHVTESTVPVAKFLEKILADNCRRLYGV